MGRRDRQGRPRLLHRPGRLEALAGHEPHGRNLDEQPTISPREFFALLQAIAENIGRCWPEMPSGVG